MSFVLQLFHAPGVRTISQATAFIDSDAPPAAANRARYIAFRDDILRSYPDNSQSDDDEVDNAWPEGWAHDLGEDAVLVFAVDTDYVDENLMCHLGHAAARAGLNLLDPQSGCLYRMDATCIDMQGNEMRLGTPQPPQPKQRLPKDLTEEALGAYLAAAFVKRRPDLGFVASQWRSFAELDRTAGEVRQRITFSVSLRTEEAMVGVSMDFFCPTLSAVWERLLGERVAAHMEVQHKNPRRRPDLTLHTDDFADPPGPLATELGRRQYAYVRSFADADAFIARFDTWYAQQAAIAFERLTTPAALARLALTDAQIHWLLHENNLPIEGMFSRLVLVGAYDAQRKDEWMKALRDHRKRQGRPGGTDSIVPNRDAALEDLANMMGTEAFATAAAQLLAMPVDRSPWLPPQSYLLHLWEHPVGRGWPRDLPAAQAWLTQMRAAPPGQNPRFLELARLLTARYPNITTPQSADKSPLTGNTQDPVYAIDLNTGALGETRSFVIDTARSLGLCVLDEAAETFHYANGFVVTKERSYRHRLPENLYTDPKAPGYLLKPAADLLPLQGMVELIGLRLDSILKRNGFARRPDLEEQPKSAPDAPPPRLLDRIYRRPQPAGWSELQINVAQREQAVTLFVDCAVCLSEASRLNKQFFIANGGADDGVEHSTVFTRQHFWMTDPQSLLGTDSGLYFIAAMADLDPVLAHLTTQLQQRLFPALAACATVVGTDAFLNQGPTPSSIFFEGNYEFGEQHLVVARVARNPRFDALCQMYIERATAYRAGKRRSIFGDTVQNLKNLYAFLKVN